tara:strand:- start:853 stop:1224 length:372 start_codon:yes stop_codon:yes gene_type:complete
MKIIKSYINNKFYFILFFVGITFVSYLSIYYSLISDDLSYLTNDEIEINSKYSLSVLKQGISSNYFMIPINFAMLLAIYLITQFIPLFLFNKLKINVLSNKFLLFLTFLIGCYFAYLISIFIL